MKGTRGKPNEQLFPKYLGGHSDTKNLQNMSIT